MKKYILHSRGRHPMYIRLRVKNWRSVEEASVDLAPFTVIVGRNSSGKSNIVDALLFSSEVGRDAATAVSRRGGIASIRRWSPSKPYDVTIEVRVSISREGLNTDYARHELVLRSGREGAWHFLREDIEHTSHGKTDFHFHRDKTSVEELGSVRRQRLLGDIKILDTTSAMLIARQLGFGLATRGSKSLQVRALRPVPELMRQPQPPDESPRLAESAKNIATALRAMTKPQHDAMVDAMVKIIPGLRDVQAQAAGRYLSLAFTQAYDAQRSAEFAATEMSDGALRAGVAPIVLMRHGGFRGMRPPA